MRQFRWIMLHLAVIILVSSVAYAETATPGEASLEIPTLSGIVTAAESNRLRLDYDADAGIIIVYDKMTNQEWRSSPANPKNDKIAVGVNKMNLQSDLIITYHNDTYATNQINSFTGSINKGDFYSKLIDNGVEIIYTFPKQDFVIPVQYSLRDDVLSARILCEQIQENGKFTIMNIAFLPYFGCSGLEDEGYLVVPDGSGALINFNNDKYAYLPFNQSVYGRDGALSTQSQILHKYNTNMPLYGLVRNGYGLLAVITSGDFQSEISAEVSGKISSWNTIYSSVSFLNLETNSILANTANSKDIVLPTNQFRDFEAYEVNYYFDEMKDSGYAGLAIMYRDLLQDQGMTAITPLVNAPVEVEFIASVPTTETFLGIPYKSISPLTDYLTLAEYCETLSANGVKKLYVRYTGWSSEGMRGRLPFSINLDNRLGGYGNFLEMNSRLGGLDIQLSLNIDLLNFYKNGGGYSKLLHATRNVNSTALQVYTYNRTTGLKDSTISPGYYLAPSQVPGLATKLMQAIKKYPISSVSLKTLGNNVYSSFGKGNISRNEAGNYWKQTLDILSTSLDSLWAEEASAYALPYIDVSLETPLYSSVFQMMDESIPFYQIVTHGSMILFSEPLNESANQRVEMLRMAEYGVFPGFRIAGTQIDAITSSDYDQYFAADFSSWHNEIAQVTSWFEPLSRTAHQRIISHERLSEKLTVTSYEEGTTVFVNYGDTAVEVSGVTVEAGSYLVREVQP